MLYLVATPIGNLSDISKRALDVLGSVDLILAEDTTVSLKLLRHYQISTPIESYHRFNERQKLDHVIAMLSAGKDVALVSDAGTPGICDPGALLIQNCKCFEIPFTSIPGPSALTLAMSLSGNEGAPSQFLGFIPKKSKEKKEIIKKMVSFDGFSYAYDTPHEIEDTLTVLSNFTQEVTLFRELTKKFEEIVSGHPLSLRDSIEKRGEFVVMVRGNPVESFSIDETELFEVLTKKGGLSPSIAVKLMKEILKKNKRDLYKKFVS